MSIVSKLLNSITSAVKGKDDEKKISESREKLLKAIEQAGADGSIKAEELEEAYKLQQKLKISDEVMYELKVQVLRDIIRLALEDGVVTEDEMAIILEVKRGLNLGQAGKSDILKADLEEVQRLHDCQKEERGSISVLITRNEKYAPDAKIDGKTRIFDFLDDSMLGSRATYLDLSDYFPSLSDPFEVLANPTNAYLLHTRGATAFPMLHTRKQKNHYQIRFEGHESLMNAIQVWEKVLIINDYLDESAILSDALFIPFPDKNSSVEILVNAANAGEYTRSGIGSFPSFTERKNFYKVNIEGKLAILNAEQLEEEIESRKA